MIHNYTCLGFLVVFGPDRLFIPMKEPRLEEAIMSSNAVREQVRQQRAMARSLVSTQRPQQDRTDPREALSRAECSLSR
ncbi:hypothetical protein SRHO_G00106830 [Serrasalmus rhombeus]